MTMLPKVALQYLLPHRFLSRMVYHATRWHWKPWKNFLIGQVVRRYQVNMDEAEQSNPFAYPHFNAFFTRLLKPGARFIDSHPETVVSPADGRISQAGAIREQALFQAKGHDFQLPELLGEETTCRPYINGHFATIYLSPRDYHRVHMPFEGTLQRTVHIPGRLFSVAPFAVQSIPRLFARNERLVCHFQGECGPFAVILVGAMLVSSMHTVWASDITPPYARRVTTKDWHRKNIHLAKGALLGHFNMGSTVIVLLPHQARLHSLDSEQPIQMGQALGQLTTHQ